MDDHSDNNSGLTSVNVLYPSKGFLLLQYGQESSPNSLSRTEAEYSPLHVGHIHKADNVDVDTTLSGLVSLLDDHPDNSSGFISVIVLYPGNGFLLLQ